MKIFISLSLRLLIAAAAMSSLPAVNLLKNGDFENGTGSWKNFSWIKNSYPPIEDRQEFHSGAKSAKFIGTAKKKGGCYQRIKVKPGETYIVSGWVKTENVKYPQSTGIKIELISSRNGKSQYRYQWLGLSGSASKWTRLQREVTAGPNDKSLAVFLWSDVSPGGNTWFDDICIEEKLKPGNTLELKDVRITENMGIFDKNESIPVDVALKNTWDSNKEIQARYEVYDFFSRKVAEGVKTINAEALKESKYRVPIPGIGDKGFFALKAELLTPGAKTFTAAFCVLPEIPRREAFFTSSVQGFKRSMLSQLKRMGIGSIPIFVSPVNFYSGTGETLNEEKMKELDGIVERYHKEGFEIRFEWVIVPDYFAQLPSVRKTVKQNMKAGKKLYTEECLAKIRGVAGMLAQRYKGKIREWILIDEIDLAMHRDPRYYEAYLEANKIIIDEAKKIDPGIFIAGCTVSGPDCALSKNFKTARKVLKDLNGKLDGFFPDAYIEPNCYGRGMPVVGPEKGQLKKILTNAYKLAEANGVKKVGISEAGYCRSSSEPLDGENAKKMANAVARGYIIAKSLHFVVHWGYYMLVNWGAGSRVYGFWEADRVISPAIATYAATADQLAFARFDREVKLHKDIYCYIFKKGNKTVSAIWSLADAPLAFKWQAPAGTTVYNIMNNPCSDKNLVLTDAPFFIVSAAGPDEMEKSFRAAKYILPELSAELHLKSLHEIEAVILNKTAENLNLDYQVKISTDKVKVKNPSGSFRIDGRNGTLKINIAGASFDKLQGAEINLVLKTANNKYSVSKTMQLLPVRRLASGNAGLDGTLRIFANMPPALKMEDSKCLMPKDAIPAKLWTGPNDLSANIYLAYDNKYFYFGAKVHDDELVSKHKGPMIWANDSIQMAFDMAADAAGTEVGGAPGYDSKNDYEFALALSSKGTEAYCYHSPGLRLNGPAKFKAVIKRLEKRKETIYEAAIPWAELRPFSPEAGAVFGYNATIFDPDSRHRALYWLEISPGIAGGKAPNVFRKCVLLPSN
jgi:hypothetical protein